jgi:alanyl-tRNA synthetase
MQMPRYDPVIPALTDINCYQILQSVVSQGKKLGKAVYVFSSDLGGSKVAHVNYVPPSMKAKGADARVWATRVSEVLGGKVSRQNGVA